MPKAAWRYEYLDGSGPWFYPDGHPRDINNIPPYENNKDVLCGCDTIKNLDKYMAKNGVNTADMYLVHYFNIEVIEYNPETGHTIFLKEGFE